MESKQAKILQNVFDNEDCEHDFKKEVVCGTCTGDYMCTKCESTFSRDSYEQILEQRSNKQK